MDDRGIAASSAAPQHGPRPLPLFLEMLRRETQGDPARRVAALNGLAAYQAASRPPRWIPPPSLAAHGRVSLRDYGGPSGGTPIIVVPSLINPPFILDLDPERSLLRWLGAQGHRVLLVDWGTPARHDPCSLADHAAILGDLIDGVSPAPVVIGYCLGGTIAIAAAARRALAGLALIAAPWRFGGFEASAREGIAALWKEARPACAALGLVPMEVLQAGFWRLDPRRTIAKYEAFAALAPDSAEAAAFVALEDWANAGAPLPFAAGRDLFELCYSNDAPGRGAWTVGGEAVRAEDLACPILDIVSTRDRIVPAATALGRGSRHESAAGHVGMVVGSHRQAALWQPLAAWLGRIALAPPTVAG